MHAIDPYQFISKYFYILKLSRSFFLLGEFHNIHISEDIRSEFSSFSKFFYFFKIVICLCCMSCAHAMFWMFLSMAVWL